MADAAAAACNALASCWPDASRAVVVLPELRAAPGFKRALGAAAKAGGHASVLPPLVITLNAWLEGVKDNAVEAASSSGALPAVTAPPELPRAARIAALHQVLKARGWFGGAPPWQTCAAILELADELSAVLPEPLSETGFSALIARHYRAAAARVAAPEAKLVLEVWRSFAPGLARRQRLQALAASAAGPVVWISTRTGGVLDAEQRRVLDACAAHLPVTLIAPRALPVWLATAWAAPGPASLMQRAQTMQQAGDVSASAAAAQEAGDVSAGTATLVPSAVELIAAHSLEGEAAAVAAQVKTWLAAGCKSIALIAFDRLTARRARALLERDQILIADESGWKLSTTSAATCAMRFADAVMSGFHQRDLLDWLKSPYAFGDIDVGSRKAAVALIERAIGKSNVLAGLGAVRRAVLALEAEVDTSGAVEQTQPAIPAIPAIPTTPSTTAALALALLARLDTAARPWRRRSAPPGEWFALLSDTLRDLGALEPLAQDLAGQGVLELIEDLRRQLTEHAATACSIAEWRACFAAELEAAVFRDSSIDSPVLLTSLGGARLRQFDAVLMIGADASHLAAAGDDGLFLSTRLRTELKLTTPHLRQEELQDDLGTVMSSSPRVTVTWQASKRGDANPLAPWFERLDALNIAAGRGSLIRMASRATPQSAHGGLEGEAGARLSVASSPASNLPAGAAPAPRAAALTPARVSVSAYGSLIACPYQFFARHLLRLNEPDEVREEFEKRDYGEWVHKLLNRFHQRFPRITGVPRAELAAALATLADEVFAPAIAFNFLSTGWKLRWLALADSYLDWQQAREEEGWTWQEGETTGALEIALTHSAPQITGAQPCSELQANAAITLTGRLDRIDVRRDGAIDILDYKTQSRAVLNNKLAEAGEDVQLAAYRLLKMEAGVAQAAFVSLDGTRVHTVHENEAHLPEDEWQRISTLFGAMQGNAPLPANAIDAVCSYCEMRGLCRRDYWRDDMHGGAALEGTT